MSTLAELATKALHDDFSPGRYGTIARDAIRTAIGMVFRTTGLARGDYAPAAITLPAGQLGVTLSDTALRISSVSHIDTGQPLGEVSIDDIATAQQRQGAAHGRPAYYAITGAGLSTEGLTLVFFPVPDVDYMLQVIGTFAPGATDLNDDTDLVPIAKDYEDMLVHYARSEMFGLEGDTALSDHHLGRFNGRLTQFRGDVQRRSNRTRRVAGTWSDLTGAAPRFRHPQGLF